jgi:hypothetical protein
MIDFAALPFRFGSWLLVNRSEFQAYHVRPSFLFPRSDQALSVNLGFGNSGFPANRTKDCIYAAAALPVRILGPSAIRPSNAGCPRQNLQRRHKRLQLLFRSNFEAEMSGFHYFLLKRQPRASEKEATNNPPRSILMADSKGPLWLV